MLQQITNSPSFAPIVALYSEPLPHEIRGQGYMQAVCVARIRALRTVLGEPVIAWHAPGMRPGASPAVRPKAAKAPKRMTAEQFFDMYQLARKAVAARYGNRWTIEGMSRWATLPAGWRSFTGPRGGKVKLPKDIRVPAAEFWPAGVMPAELVLADDTPRQLTAFVCRLGETVPIHPMLARLADARAEQWEIDAPWRYRRAMQAHIAAARSSRRSCFETIRLKIGYYNMTVDQAHEKLVRVRIELMADLRRFRETGSFAEPAEQSDAMSEAAD